MPIRCNNRGAGAARGELFPVTRLPFHTSASIWQRLNRALNRRSAMGVAIPRAGSGTPLEVCWLPLEFGDSYHVVASK